MVLSHLVWGASMQVIRRELFVDKQLGRNLSGQVVLISGGSKGLGLLLARQFGSLGARVAIFARDEGELVAASKWLSGEGVQVDTFVCDVSNEDEVEALIGHVETRLGSIDVLVNNAGVIQVGPLDALQTRDFAEAMGIMFWGVVHPTLAVLPSMRRRRSGRIVNITSIGGKVSTPHLLAYNSAKFAAVGFSEGLHGELAATGIHVTTVVPGLMRTGSFVNAVFKGKPAQEFAWFTTLSSLPFVSIDAEKAARRIVAATLGNEPELILSLPANLMARAHGVAPGLSLKVVSLVARLLPNKPRAQTRRATGEEVEESRLAQRLSPLLVLGRKAVDQYQARQQRRPA
jgi:short-subunit dehydrogenase